MLSVALGLNDLDRDARTAPPRPKERALGMISILTEIHRLVLADSPVGFSMTSGLPGRRTAFGFERRAEISRQGFMPGIEPVLGDHTLKILFRLSTRLFDLDGLDLGEKFLEYHRGFLEEAGFGGSNRSVRITERNAG